MNDIQVGDRVWASGLGDGRMLAVHDDYGWVLWNTHDHCTARLDSLTRIEPEPVTLTPKYAAGERVRTKDDEAYVVGEILVAYRSQHGYLLLEDSLEPIPSPCPTCGKE